MSDDVETIPEVNIGIEKERLKPRIITCVFADYIGLTISGKPDVCGIYDRIFIHPEIADFASVTVFVRLLEASNGQFKITIYDPENGLVGMAESKIQDLSDKPYPRFVQFVQTVVLENLVLGIYWFDISFNGESIGGMPLTVAEVEVAEAEKEKKHDDNN